MTKKTIIKRIGYSIISVILLAVAIVYTWSSLILDKTYHVAYVDA